MFHLVPLQLDSGVSTSYVIDYAFARPEPQRIKDAGYTGVLRYVCPINSSTRPKVITASEMVSLRGHGLDVTLNFEWYERRPLEGFAAGVADAQVADTLADQAGYPRDCAIYYSVDFGATWPQVSEYFRGVHSTSRRPVGVYGGVGIIQAAQAAGWATYGWVTNAASWSGFPNWTAVKTYALSHPGFHLLQHLHTNTPFHIPGVDDTAFDPNTVVAPNYGQWSVHGQEENLFVNESDLDLLRAESNRVIGTLQSNMKGEWIPAIVAGVTAAVAKASGKTVDPNAVATAVAAELAKRLEA